MSDHVLITGANRGIGLELARKFHLNGDQVTALCRKSSPELRALGIQVIEEVNVTDFDRMRHVASEIGKGIDILICNAGILRNETLETVNNGSFDSIEEQFQVNTLGPLKTVGAFSTRMAKSSKIALITSRMGSIADNSSGGRYGYRMSKCALNIAGKSLALDLAPRGISVAILHPGFVQTDMTGKTGNLKPSESAAHLFQRINQLDLAKTGTFWHCEGEILPW